MPPDPSLFTRGDIDAKTLRRRMDLWIDKTFYVLRRMNQGGYCRMGKPEALEMAEKMAERMSGLTVAYRHLLDAHLLASYIHHLARLSDYLIATEHLLRTHDRLFSDLYSKAFLCVEEMTPAGVSQILSSYDVFRADVKKIEFKVDTTRYPAGMDHESLIRKLLKRFEDTMEFALPVHLLRALASLHTIDSRLTDFADRIFDRLIESLRVDASPFVTVAEFLYCLGLWSEKNRENRSTALHALVDRIDAATEAEIKALNANAFGKLLYAFGCLRRTESSALVLKTRVWFDERFNGYEMLPRDLARCAFGYAFADAFDSDLVYLLRKQALRRSGYFRRPDLRILRQAFVHMDAGYNEEMETQLLSGDKRFFERVYGHR